MLAALGVAVVCWLIAQVAGELGLRHEYTRSGRLPERESVLRRVDPVTGRPWSDVERRAAHAATIAALTDACADLDAVTGRTAVTR